jgi:hypothetical protein
MADTRWRVPQSTTSTACSLRSIGLNLPRISRFGVAANTAISNVGIANGSIIFSLQNLKVAFAILGFSFVFEVHGGSYKETGP